MSSTENSSPDAERARGQAQRLQVQQEARVGDVWGGGIQRRRARTLRSCLHQVFCFMRTWPSCTLCGQLWLACSVRHHRTNSPSVTHRRIRPHFTS